MMARPLTRQREQDLMIYQNSVSDYQANLIWIIANFYKDKKLLVTCLQHTHNWTMGNDRFKMSFWFDMLFDDVMRNDNVHYPSFDNLNVEVACQEVNNWLCRQTKKDKVAVELLENYKLDENSPYSPGPLPKIDDILQDHQKEAPSIPVWKPELEDKFEQDRLYARVSHEIDIWWKKVRDINFEGWIVTMETVEGARQRAAECKENTINRYMTQAQEDNQYESNMHYGQLQHQSSLESNEIETRSSHDEICVDDEEEEDEDDDSYVEGSLRGLLTEIPNILDTKQIEALHMTVKACIVDSMGSGLTPVGENLQKTRCKMFLALDCGKNLLRELLVFIAVWEQTDQQFIFQITAQVIESFHHNALLPYAWDSLRILKDIVSPAQTVLLRLINYMFRARKDSPIYDDVKDYNRDAKLIFYLYSYFRCRVVPDCLAVLDAQAQVRQNKRHPSYFPVDSWDMERAKDGLAQYLDFISVIAEIPEMRHLLIEWEAVYELISLLKALEAGVARKLLDERSNPNNTRRSTPELSSPPMFSFDTTMSSSMSAASIPALQDAPYKFAWPGVKNQILIILTCLISPVSPRRTGPGNPIVQKQLLAVDGIIPLLNCCVYDGNNEYLKERATLTMKYLMEGCKEAQDFVKELVPVKQAQVQAQAAARAQVESQSQAKGKLQTSPVLPVDLSTGKASSSNEQTSTSSQTSLNGAQDVEAKIKELEKNIKMAQLGSTSISESEKNTDHELATIESNSSLDVKTSGKIEKKKI